MRVGAPALQGSVAGTGRHRDGRRVPASSQEDEGGGGPTASSPGPARGPVGGLSRALRGRGRRRRVLGDLAGRGSRRRTGWRRRRAGWGAGLCGWRCRLGGPARLLSGAGSLGALGLPPPPLAFALLVFPFPCQRLAPDRRVVVAHDRLDGALVAVEPASCAIVPLVAAVHLRSGRAGAAGEEDGVHRGIDGIAQPPSDVEHALEPRGGEPGVERPGAPRSGRRAGGPRPPGAPRCAGGRRVGVAAAGPSARRWPAPGPATRPPCAGAAAGAAETARSASAAAACASAVPVRRPAPSPRARRRFEVAGAPAGGVERGGALLGLRLRCRRARWLTGYCMSDADLDVGHRPLHVALAICQMARVLNVDERKSPNG